VSAVIAVLLDSFERPDDVLQVVVDLPVVVGLPAPAGTFGEGDQFERVVTLSPVDR